MLTSVLYISRSTIDPDDAESQVGAIVAAAMPANRQNGLTGALLFTGTHFAQLIEGREQEIDILISALQRDPRHDELQIVARMPIADRRFKDWSMAYFGPSQFVARHVTRLLGSPSTAEQHRAADWLTDLLHEFVRHPAA